jgi:hypothetical protein
MAKMLKGNSQDVIDANIRMLKDSGYSHSRATRCALCHANKKHSKHEKGITAKITKKNSQVTIK